MLLLQIRSQARLASILALLFVLSACGGVAASQSQDKISLEHPMCFGDMPLTCFLDDGEAEHKDSECFGEMPLTCFIHEGEAEWEAMQRAAAVSQERAIAAALTSLAAGSPGVTGVEEARDPVARLMTLGEYEERYTSGRSAGERDRLVWVVQVEGTSRSTRVLPDTNATEYSYTIAVVDAVTGKVFASARRFEPILFSDGPVDLPHPQAWETALPTATPAPVPPVAPTRIGPPTGSGAEVGKAYPFSFGRMLHCGVEPVRFDGRLWMAMDVPEEWTYTVPTGWTIDEANGEIVLVGEDAAIYTSRSGLTIEYAPRSADEPHLGCV